MTTRTDSEQDSAPVRTDFWGNLIEQHFTKVVLAACCFFVSISILPYAFHHVEEESLIELAGSLENIEVHFGVTTERNTFEISIQEFPGKTFLAAGLRPIDQTLLTHNETLGNWFKFSVGKKAFRTQTKEIKIYHLSSAVNTYINASDNAEIAEKERVLVISVISISFFLGLSILLGIKSKMNRIKKKNIDPPTDELLILFVKYPRVLLSGLFAAVGIFFFAVLPPSVRLYSVGTALITYGALLQWIQAKILGNLWIMAMLSKDAERQTKLAVRQTTTAPKHLKAVELFLQKGGNVNAQDKAGQTPLLIAAKSGIVEAVTLLLRKDANPNLADHTGMTALMVAADKGFLGMVTALLNAGALVNLANQQGINALTLAQGEKKNPAVLELLTKASEHEKQETAKKLAHEAEEAKKNEGTPPGAAA